MTNYLTVITCQEVSGTALYYHFSTEFSTCVHTESNFVPSALVTILGTYPVTGSTLSFSEVILTFPEKRWRIWICGVERDFNVRVCFIVK